VPTAAEQQHRCADSPGPVGDGEELAHYLSSDETFDRNAGVAREAAFKTKRLLGKDKYRSEECGDSWGESMDRIGQTSPNSMRARALEFGDRPGQQPAPVAVVTAAAIRGIASPKEPSEQLLEILDDGCVADPGHAVLRARAGVSPAGVSEARRQLLQKLQLIELTDGRFVGQQAPGPPPEPEL
jgi:hypothetical protein